MASLIPVFVHLARVQQNAQLVLAQLQTAQRPTETLATGKGRKSLWSRETSGCGSRQHAPAACCITPVY